ncbi:hypothetical protein GCK72_014974 [Caenorhabditis remanei]|uniref:Uncharacterized protein n=1 Tax=Caenorhabditis remanei TaxID=31234 RepID=A0A6A5GV77_CAERE|nr:hypothetical protein GCK72_014974 [Caenorhabditis remanei]KAF1758516.1 hypothetical protein GCK72_014974 [Caenorhabditis remanei]
MLREQLWILQDRDESQLRWLSRFQDGRKEQIHTNTMVRRQQHQSVGHGDIGNLCSEFQEPDNSRIHYPSVFTTSSIFELNVRLDEFIALFDKDTVLDFSDKGCGVSESFVKDWHEKGLEKSTIKVTSDMAPSAVIREFLSGKDRLTSGNTSFILFSSAAIPPTSMNFDILGFGKSSNGLLLVNM